MRRLAILMLAIAAIGCDLPEPREPPFLEVRVAVDGQPEAGVLVGYSRQTPKNEPQWPAHHGYSDSTGVFRAVELERATYGVDVSVEGHRRGGCVSDDAGWSPSPSGPSRFGRTIRFEGRSLTLVIDVRCPLAAFVTEAAQYKEVAGRGLEQGEATGAFIVLTPEGIDETLTWRLPKHLRPQRASEVKTVVWIERRSELSGFYIGGGPGYRSIFTVSLINRQRRVPIARQEFTAGPPATVDSRVAIGSGERPDTEILRYLAQFGE